MYLQNCYQKCFADSSRHVSEGYLNEMRQFCKVVIVGFSDLVLNEEQQASVMTIYQN